jgi:acyl-CoA reductase-like NAD-dependent aldehyde dehydrogenase
MMMSIAEAETLIARNPATGAEIARIPATPPESVASLVVQARDASIAWASRPIRERIEVVARWWAILSREAESLAIAIRDEIGKPLPEAQMEVTAALDAIRWTVKNARSALADSRIGPGWQRMALMGAARLRWTPLGVVGIVGTWNYPVFLDAPAIAQALVAGNAVAWKPSESAIHVADRIRASLERCGLPPGLVTPLFGGPEIGQALVASHIDKAFFTGGTTNGRVIAAALAARGIPTVAELSGFDAAIVRADAPLDSTARALTWASFVGAGQTCVAVKRIYVVGDAWPLASDLARRARDLRVGDPAMGSVDLGPMISEASRSRFHKTLLSAIDAGAEVLEGTEPIVGPGSFYRPTVLLARDDAPERVLEGVFGPVVVVRGVEDDEAAIRAANARDFGLAASVWGRDRKTARAVASRLRAGTVTINDAVTPTGLASAPFGGTKASGYGRVRGVLGLREFASPQVVHERGPGGFRPHLFPYSDRLGKIFSFYRKLFHPSA